VEETAGPKDLERKFILHTTNSGLTGPTFGWVGNWTDLTPISQRLASGDLLYANWGRLFQDITHVIAPCGTCEP
jgi:hypothetical protein